ncbi:unnamed protein product [Adineta steineri]|uniref:U3 small nucleolar ribonucleoprotein protein MPP10 n=1 Tax=Adineta steineri TaxID=433720 RepID=A0A815R4H6_9BILA|nr:unnamed protein product [Adineta steineri]CAF1636039.1 unnamed protein product [Adineta steineri]
MVNSPVSASNEQRNDDRVFSYLSKVEDFVISDKQRSETFSNYIKHFADLKCSLLPSSFTTVTPLSVHVKGFEPEQIYQQLKSINDTRFKPFVATIAKTKTKQKTFGNLLQPPSPEPSLNEENNDDDEINDEEILTPPKKTPKKKKSVTFFDSNALNKFLDEQDVQEMSNFNRKTTPEDEDDLELDDDEDDGGLFADEDNEGAIYDSFFDPPDEKKKKKNKKDKIENKKNHMDSNLENLAEGKEEEQEQEEDEEDYDDMNLENKSDFEKQQIHLKRQIKSIEKDMLDAKPWQLTGEIEGQRRPENSLLEEYLQYDRTTRLPPVITNETTDSLEDLIKQRIRDKVFDDVERKKKNPHGDEAQAYKKEILLEHEKSKMSLAEVYEQEYLKKQTNDKTEKKDERHETIRNMMQDLFVDLDALSNFRFTPRPPVPEVTIVNNLPAILVEEIVPTTVNDSTLLAPEEVHIRPKGDVKASTERTDTDKKHARRLLKHKQKLKSKDEPKKSTPEEESKVEKRDLLKKLGKMKNVRIEKTDKNRSNEKTARSSTKFFEKLQQSTLTAPTKKPRRSDSTTITDSKRLKL